MPERAKEKTGAGCCEEHVVEGEQLGTAAARLALDAMDSGGCCCVVGDATLDAAAQDAGRRSTGGWRIAGRALKGLARPDLPPYNNNKQKTILNIANNLLLANSGRVQLGCISLGDAKVSFVSLP